MWWKTCIALVSALFFGGLNVALCNEVYFIVPSRNYSCSNYSCMTLSQYAVNTAVRNTSLIFAKGHHSLNVTVSVSNIDSLIMLAADNDSVSITCTDASAYFDFTSIGLVHVSNLTFTACGNNRIESVKQLIVKWSTFTGGGNRSIDKTLLQLIETNAYVDTTVFSNGMGMHTSQNLWNHTEFFSATIGGAMIVMKSNITINKSTFEANWANIGGAIYFGDESNIIINNSVFTFNSARNCPNRFCLGGALFINETSKATITNSKFENNTSDGDGGMAAVFNATLLVSKCSTLKNRATRGGGIIAAFQQSDIVFNTSILKSCTAHNGGAIYLHGGSLNISGCIVSNNKAIETGGVLFMLTEGNVAIDNHSIISDNMAVSGGVIHATDIENNIAMIEIIISNSSFNNNKASLNGGVLSLTYLSTNTIMRNSIFCHNTAGSRGGVLSMIGSGNSASILSSNFSHNIATIYGGVASLIYGGDLLATNSSFDNNVADVNGGVFNCYSSGNITVIGSYFVNNRADTGGGVVNIKNRSTLHISSSHFFKNVDIDLGAVVLAIDANVITIHSCNFTNNSAIYGGVMIATLNNNITVSKSTFHGNRAASNGGTIYTRRSCNTIITNCTFGNNRAVNDGTIIAAGSSKIQIKMSNFSYNTAGHDGGVAYTYDNSIIDISGCHLKRNGAENSGGVIYGLKNSVIKLSNSTCEWNSAQNSGGGIHAQKNTSVFIEASNFSKNRADYGGGVHVYVKSVAKISSCNFNDNKANVAGGSLTAYESSTISAHTSNFSVNLANVGGVAIAFQSTLNNIGNNNCRNHTNFSEISFKDSNFVENTANHGGALYIQGSHVAVVNSSFVRNHARYTGGVIYSVANSSICIDSTTFCYNGANDGGVMIIIDNSNMLLNFSAFFDNSANQSGGIMHLQQSSASVYSSIFVSSHAGINGGVLLALNSLIKVKGSDFCNSSAGNTGGAVDAYSDSNLTVENCNFLRNTAGVQGGSLYIAVNSSSFISNSTFKQNEANKYGGAISVLSSKIVFIGCENRYLDVETGQGASIPDNTNRSYTTDISKCQMKILKNEAVGSGGGIYLEKSDLYFINSNINISFNTANISGGGLHAVNSSITSLESNIVFYSNQVSQFGGGISLASSKFYDIENKGRISNISLIYNHAYEGGAIYIDDERKDGVCSNNPFKGNYSKDSGCFFQDASNLNFNFFNNSATSGGDNLFGGLLDRCTVASKKNNISHLESRGISQFLARSHLVSYNTITSRPVRLCLCSETMIADCEQQTTTIHVKINDSFSFYAVAVDQVNKSVAATVKSSFSGLILEESETIRRIGTNCSKLKYRVPFKKSRETYKLTIFPDGPCGNKSISMMTISIHVNDCMCPPGFMKAKTDTKCECVCDKRYEIFTKYISECNITNQLVTRKGSFWIFYLGNTGNTSPYFIYPHCPLDYCQPSSKEISINLSLPNGSDSQCANNRGGILCGKCLPNHSLSLGSSKCIQCPDNWYGSLITIIVAAFFAGIILVVALLVLNLTVAVGTLNSVIFYANVIYANRSIYFHHSSLVFASTFVSWINLNIGFDVCFIEGLDSYTKTWLELAFPIYIIILVVLIIIVSSHSSKFSHQLGKKNPVATLATLILLSYTKLLETIIVSFSFISLKYPNGTVATKWLPDASVHFKGWKQAALICMGILVLILGLLYTTLIFSWQWLLHCSRSKFFRWTRNQKLHSFIDIYHIPCTAQHHYWTGLLLLVRIIVYLVSTFTVSIDSRISLSSTVITMCCLLAYKTFLTVRIYKYRLLNVMESIVHLNIAVFAIITWCTMDEPSNGYTEAIQRVVTYISVGMIFVLLLLVIIYHIFRYASIRVYAVCLSSNLGKVMKHHLEYYDREQASSNRDDYNLLDYIDDPRELEGYTAPPLQLHHGPTVTTTTISMTESEKSEAH